MTVSSKNFIFLEFHSSKTKILCGYDIKIELVARVIQCFCFPERSMKGGHILDFQKGGKGILEKGGGWLIHLNLALPPPPKT